MSSKNSDKTSWWYYFELIDEEKIEKCKSCTLCTWQRERDIGKYKSLDAYTAIGRI
jgi:hypothetical protein